VRYVVWKGRLKSPLSDCRFSDEDKFSGGMEVTEYLSYKYLRFTDFVLTLFIKYGRNKIYS
ncbi:hypothetical protein, partial [Enterocloster clostridioformis]|uniref:hypothetical protein n=1 Tax=Enterocloster clostridioformis TaxID=1531 RepID=UPI0022E06B26